MLSECDKDRARPAAPPQSDPLAPGSLSAAHAMLLVCLLSGESTASGLGMPCSRSAGPTGQSHHEVATHVTASQRGTSGKPPPSPFWFS